MSPPEGTKPGDTLTLFTNDSNGDAPVEARGHGRRHLSAGADPAGVVVLVRAARVLSLGQQRPRRSTDTCVADDVCTSIRVAEAFRITEWELRPETDGLSRHDAAVLADQFNEIADVGAAHRRRRRAHERTAVSSTANRCRLSYATRARRRRSSPERWHRCDWSACCRRSRCSVRRPLGDARAATRVAPAIVEGPIPVVARVCVSPGVPPARWSREPLVGGSVGVGCRSLLRSGIGVRDGRGPLSHRVRAHRSRRRVRRDRARGGGTSQDVRRQPHAPSIVGSARSLGG